jgi:hypothetical protein
MTQPNEIVTTQETQERDYCSSCKTFSVLPNHCDQCGDKLVARPAEAQETRELEPQVLEVGVRICADCLNLKGEMCHNAACVFCRRTMAEVGDYLDALLIAPVVDGERIFLPVNSAPSTTEQPLYPLRSEPPSLKEIAVRELVDQWVRRWDINRFDSAEEIYDLIERITASDMGQNPAPTTEQVIRLDHALRLALSRAQVDRMMELQRQGFAGTIYEAWERGLMPEEYRPAWELLQPKAETEGEQNR